jgi:predicted DCC family thiol-disulfide oxidoreductase YuxK
MDLDKKKKLKFAALQSEKGEFFLKKFNLKQNDFDTFIFIDEEENYFIKSTAALKIAKLLPYPIKIIYSLIIIPKICRDFLYNIIAKNRYNFFGKKDTCRIPTLEEKERFL